MKTFFRRLILFLLALALVCGVDAWCFPALALAQTLPTVSITATYADRNSVKVDFAPVAGAKDYRVYDVTNPMDVKYAGVWHLDADQLGQWSSVHFAVDSVGNFVQPLTLAPNRPATTPGQPWTSPDAQYHHADVPATEIEWNGLTPGQPVTLVVEAVDALGPTPPANGYDANNNPVMNASAPSMGGEGMDTMLGANAGTTPDGMTSTNGQGPATDKPNVVARSQPFTVTCTTPQAIPSSASAISPFFEDFTNGGTFTPAAGQDIVAGVERMTMTTPAGAWDVVTDGADIRDSRAFLMNHHFMDVLFDGSTPGSNDPLHVAHGVLAISPQATADFSGGKIVHIVMEVDAHTDDRRWVGINVAPANDPLVHWYNGNQINNSDTAFFIQVQANTILADEYTGPKADGTPNDIAIAGPAGGAMNNGYRQPSGYQYGHGLDDRSRFDLFLSTTHFSAYEDGKDIEEYDLPQPLAFSTAKVYFTHYVYHTGLEPQELAQQQRLYETYWLNMFPYSDERHWDNMGFEVLPAGTPWASLASLIQMPAAQAPVYVQSGAGGSNGGSSSGSSGGSVGGGTVGNPPATVTVPTSILQSIFDQLKALLPAGS